VRAEEVKRKNIRGLYRRPATSFFRIFGGLAVFCCLCAGLISNVSGQSGRTRDPKNEQKVKPIPPPPLPRPKAADAPKDESTIRISSDLVTVVATVTNRDGLKGELAREDFEILEDGAPQEISDFARDSDAPLRMVMLFDTSLSIASRLDFERRAAARFLERVMRPQDQAALFSFATDTTVLQDFTSRVPLLISAMKQLRAQGSTSLYDAIYLAADYLKDAPGRHIILIISDGGDTTSSKDLKTALAHAQQADAIIYPIFTGNLWPSQNVRDLAAERALSALAAETGGETFFPRARNGADDPAADEQTLSDLNGAFARLTEQLRTQYTLGFYSSNDSRDGAFRKLQVRVKKSGYAARARHGYYAPKG
jgi:Ca-activated chloride channel family protein